MRCKIKFWLKINVVNPAKRKKKAIEIGIRNLVYWLPVIWKDRNNDPDYMLAILRHKMAEMKAELPVVKGLTWNISAHQNALALERVIRLADRILADKYEDHVSLGRKSTLDKLLEELPGPLTDEKLEYVFGNMSAEVEAVVDSEAREMNVKARELKHMDLVTLFDVLGAEYNNLW